MRIIKLTPTQAKYMAVVLRTYQLKYGLPLELAALNAHVAPFFPRAQYNWQTGEPFDDMA